VELLSEYKKKLSHFKEAKQF